MNPIVRGGLMLGVLLLAALAAWQLLGIIRSDAALDRGDPAAALQWRPENPESLLRIATVRLESGDAAGAESLARRLLAAAPADGRGYRLLAQVAEQRGDAKRAASLYSIAVRRAPRDLQARAWLAQRALAAGDYSNALDHIDKVLRMSPGSNARLFPVLVQLAADPGFADALAGALVSHPPWRDSLLATLHAAEKSPGAADQVLAGLQRRNDLDPATTGAWIEALIRQGRWGEAFARWAGPHVASGRPLPLLYNGDFSSEPQGAGFDWRVASIPGVLVSVEPLGKGGMLHLRFLGRRVAGGPVASHALVLAPGSYRLEWRERVEALRAATGLAWGVSCAGTPQSLAQAEPRLGTRPFEAQELVFTVPEEGCNGQWLQLVGVGDSNAGQLISGDAWYSSMKVTRQSLR